MTIKGINIPHAHARRITADIFHGIVLVLSLLLIVYISYDTFESIPFLDNHHYMTFQFWVCVAFLGDFFVELFLSINKKEYLKTRWFFFLISIPYLNIINQYNINFSSEILFYIRFIPLIRGAYSLAMVIGYISNDRAYSLMSQYVAILLSLIYILSLIFFYEEHGVNSNVKTFWDALYFSAMNCSTVGCYFSAVTPVGKIISVILPTSGMLMLPLFTVVITNKVKSFDQKRRQMLTLFEEKEEAKAEKTAPATQTTPVAPTPAPAATVAPTPASATAANATSAPAAEPVADSPAPPAEPASTDEPANISIASTNNAANPTPFSTDKPADATPSSNDDAVATN